MHREIVFLSFNTENLILYQKEGAFSLQLSESFRAHCNSALKENYFYRFLPTLVCTNNFKGNIVDT
jgi:hypothetical protein